jgi:hypothetical protein
LVIKAIVEALIPDPTHTVTVGTFDNVTVASVQFVLVEDATQLVVSTFDCGFDCPVCARVGVGVNHPENSRPRVKVAIINASSIGRRPA